MHTTNQLGSLGAEQDLKDAAAIRKTLAIWGPRLRRGSPAQNIARKVLVDAWQEPRLPDPCYDRIRPIDYPWSESARDHFFNGSTKRKITLEHVKPAKYLLDTVLFPAAADPNYTDEMFLDLLIEEHRRLSFTVVTEIEDTMINNAGFKDEYVESEDDWARYRLSGIDISTFMALSSDPRFDKNTMTVVRRGVCKVLLPGVTPTEELVLN